MRVTLEELKSLPSIVHTLPQKEVYSFTRFSMGFPKTGLMEISGVLGSGKTEFLLQFLKESPELEVAWIEKNFTFFPSILLNYQLHPERFLFLDLSSPKLKRSPLWGVSQILRSQVFPLIILSGIDLQESELRHLQLSARQADALIIFLREVPLQNANWLFSLRIQVKRTEQQKDPTATLLKHRF